MKERREEFLTYLELRDTPLTERILHWLAGSGKYPFGDLSSWYAAELIVLPKYQPKRGGDLGWGKLFRFKCGIKNYFQLAKTNLRIQFNYNKIW